MKVYLLRYLGSSRIGHARIKKVSEFELLHPRNEYLKPKVCFKHPRPCIYDAPECPACQAEKEFVALTKDME